MKAQNVHLAFLPVTLEGKTEMTLPEMLGITEKRGEELFEIFEAARQEKTHTQALSRISHMAETPQELAFVSYVYMDYIYDHKRAEEQQKIPSGLAAALAEALEVDEVHVIHMGRL